MCVQKIINSVKKQTNPSPQVKIIADILRRKVSEIIRQQGIDADVTIGGSVAKNTHLKGDHDIDLFVRFSLSTKNISELLKKALSSLNPQVVPASRDYLRIRYEDFDVEIIPVYKISDYKQAKNIMDVSPLHVDYFIKKGVGLASEVRVAKQFCKANKIYGAESHIRGFSGHVIDLLIIHYKTFYNLAVSACDWKPPVIIDLEKHHADPLKALDQNKHSPLIIVDPMQPLRNAAAAVSKEKFDKFIMLCKEFIKKPSKDFFVIQQFDLEKIRESLQKKPYSVLAKITHSKNMRSDIAGTNIRKWLDRCVKDLKRYGFKIIDYDWEFNYQQESYAWFILQGNLEKNTIQTGPKINDSTNVSRFLKKHPDAIIKNNRYVALVKRKYCLPEELISDLAKEFTNLSISLEVFN